jgi:P-type Cu+ transporter
MEQLENAATGATVETRELKIAGMGCDNCVRKLERALRAQEGVKEVRVDGIAGLATITFDPARIDVPGLQAVVAKSGYRAGAVESAPAAQPAGVGQKTS